MMFSGLLFCVLIAFTNSDYLPNLIDSSHYHNYDQMKSYLFSLQNKYVNLATVYSIGQTVENRELYVIHITTNSSDKTKPMFKYVGNMHGNEALGRELLLYLTEYLLSNYNKISRVTKLLDTIDIYILPSANPDGFERAKEGDCDGIAQITGRNNANNIDLNRDFPDQFKVLDNNNMTAGRQPETLSLMSWIVNNPFVLSANLHGGSLVASYPFDNSKFHKISGYQSLSPDNAVFEELAHEYANIHPTMHDGHNCLDDDFGEGIVNGADWYEVDGGMQDFNYVYSNCFEITLELSCCKYPPAANLSQEWANNREPLLALMEQIHMGIKGTVRDAVTKKGVNKAFISVYGIEHNVTTTPDGLYWRLLIPGMYSVQVSSYGYKTMKKTIEVKKGNPMILDFEMEPVNKGDFLYSPSPELENDTDSSSLNTTTTTVEPSKVSNFSSDFKTQPEFKHHHYKDLESFMKKISAAYPKITKLYSIGKSVRGRELYAMRISNNPGIHLPGRPEFKYVGNMHGNEVVGREILLLLIQYLCENYGSNPRVTKILDTVQVHILPSMNPDGYELAHEGDSTGALGRKNANAVDLNRNFPDQFGPTAENLVQEPETLAIMIWSLLYPFVLSANLHGGALVANYPYDDNAEQKTGKYSKSPDDAVFRQLATVYSEHHSTMHLGQPCARNGDDTLSESFPNGITNGAHWYTLAGGMQDWNYLHTNCFELTLELGCFKYPMANDLSTYWQRNKDPLLALIEQVHVGIHGFVTDIHKQPLPNATISIAGINHNVISSEYGDYWRLLIPGKYIISVSLPGFTRNSQTVTVPAEGIQVNFTMDNQFFHWSTENDFSLVSNVENRYLNDTEIHNEILVLAHNNPDLLKSMSNFGHDGRRAIDFAYISSNIKEASNKLEIAVIGGLHMSQPGSREICIRLIRHLVEGFKRKDVRIVKLLETVALHIYPTVQSVKKLEDIMDAGTDPAMDLGDKFGSDYDGMFDTVEALKQNFMSYHYDAIISLEANGLETSFPSSIVRSQNSNGAVSEVFQQLASAFSKHHSVLSVGTMCEKKTDSLLPRNGPGTMLDFVFDTYGTYAIAAHVTCCSYSKPDELPALWANNLEPLMDFFEATKQGVLGKITNQAGEPLTNAQAHVMNGNQTLHVDPKYATFRVILPPGSYVFHISCDGYELDTETVNVVEKQLVNLKVILDPLVQNVDAISYDSLTKSLKALHDLRKDITSLYSIGQTTKKNEIWVLEINSTSANSDICPPTIRLTAGLNGNEVVATQLLIRLAKYLIRHQGHDSAITDHARVLIAPLLNPDNVMNEACLPSNSGMPGYIDLDTDFKEHKDHYQPETEAIMKWLSTSPATLSISFYSGAKLVLYPPRGSQKTDIKLSSIEEEMHIQLARSYSHSHQQMHLGSFSCNNKNYSYPEGIAKAAFVHTHSGSFLDYEFQATGSAALSVYVDCCDVSPTPIEMQRIWSDNKEPLLTILNEALKGVHGIISSLYERSISNAEISVKGFSHISLSHEDGTYHRLLPPGEHLITVTAEGYFPLTKIVKVYSDKATIVDFKLKEDSNIWGIPKSIFIVISGSIVLIILVGALCIYTLSLQRCRGSYKFQRLDATLPFLDEEDEVGSHSMYETNKRLLSKKTYHDNSSSDEDELYNTYRWQNGQKKSKKPYHD